MTKQICITALAAMMALAFILGITPSEAGEETTAPVAASEQSDALPVGVRQDETEDTEAYTIVEMTAGNAPGGAEAALPSAEISYAIPSDAVSVGLYINGRQMSKGFGARYGGVIYLPFEDFRLLFDDGGGEINLSATPGDVYIVSGERYIPCSYDSLDVTVLEWNGCVRIPLTAAASAAGLDVIENADGSVSLTGVPDFPDAGEVYDADDLYWLSRIISAESRGEPFEGQVAVGCVVLNRVRSSKYPGTIYEVVFDNRFGIQFSPAYSGSVYREPAAVSVIAAKLCLEGLSVSDSILFFFNSSIAAGTWITSNRTYTMTVGGHDFYS